MLDSINQGPCFTGAKYNILRVVAAFPLDADFYTRSTAVAAVLEQDHHPLAKLSRTDLTLELSAHPELKVILDDLTTKTKRNREESDEDPNSNTKTDRPQAKKRAEKRGP